MHILYCCWDQYDPNWYQVPIGILKHTLFHSMSLHAPSRTEYTGVEHLFQISGRFSFLVVQRDQILKVLNFHVSDAAISNNSTFEEVQQCNNVYASWSLCSHSHNIFRKKNGSMTLTKKKIVWSILLELKRVAKNFYKTTLCQASTIWPHLQ